MKPPMARIQSGHHGFKRRHDSTTTKLGSKCRRVGNSHFLGFDRPRVNGELGVHDRFQLVSPIDSRKSTTMNVVPVHFNGPWNILGIGCYQSSAWNGP